MNTMKKPKKQPTRREQIDKLKVKWYNQIRNLYMKQLTELQKFYEAEDSQKLLKKREQQIRKDENNQTNVSSNNQEH